MRNLIKNESKKYVTILVVSKPYGLKRSYQVILDRSVYEKCSGSVSATHKRNGELASFYLSYNGKVEYLHQFVMKFFDVKPGVNQDRIDHKNRDVRNNVLKNLRWSDARRNGMNSTMPKVSYNKRDRNYQVRLAILPEQVSKIRKLIKTNDFNGGITTSVGYLGTFKTKSAAKKVLDVILPVAQSI